MDSPGALVLVRKYFEASKMIEKVYSATKRAGVNLVIKTHNSGSGKEDNLPPSNHHIPSWVRWVDPLDPDFRDVTRLFIVSDMLVFCGSSSIGKEYLVTGKPMAHLSGVWFTDALSGKRIKCPGFSANVNKLDKTIGYALEHPEENLEAKKEWLDKLIYNPDGHASERAVKFIMERIKGEEST